MSAPGADRPPEDDPTPTERTVYEGMPSWTDGQEAVLDGHRTVFLGPVALAGWITHLQHLHHLITH